MTPREMDEALDVIADLIRSTVYPQPSEAEVEAALLELQAEVNQDIENAGPICLGPVVEGTE